MPGPEPRTLFSPPPTAAELSHSERLASLRLIRSENVGPVTFRDLIAHFDVVVPTRLGVMVGAMVYKNPLVPVSATVVTP